MLFMSVELSPLPLQVPLKPYLIHCYLREIRVKPANPTLHHVVVNPNYNHLVSLYPLYHLCRLISSQVLLHVSLL